MLMVAFCGWVTMTGFVHWGIVMTAAMLFPVPQLLTACTQNLVVVASGPITASEPKLKYSSLARNRARTASSVAPPTRAAGKGGRAGGAAGGGGGEGGPPLTRLAPAPAGG